MSENSTNDSGTGKKPDDGMGSVFAVAMLALAVFGAYKLFKGEPERKTLSDIREDDFLRDLYGEDYLK
ncbi:MAG: hypothetical protein HZC01_03490 [Candidatus Kerfeldbacteria bacterium]|nr:hypothetical protein [Candidatus Kerfeldbacteria bacterium]